MNASFVNRLIELLQPLYNNWGYLIILAGVFLESIFITGWIAPGTAVLLLGSFYAAQGELNFVAILAIACGGAILGDNVGFFAGRRLGRRVVEMYERHPRLKRGMEGSERYFDRYGGVTVLFGRMVSAIDAFIPVTAGMGRMPYWKYALFDLPGIAIWVGLIGTLGYMFGNHWETIEQVINWFGWGMLGIVALIIAVVYLVYRHKSAKGSDSTKGSGPCMED